jgi:hypothetical protein
VNWFKNIFRSKAEIPTLLMKRPFPPLTKDVFGDGSLFHWTGKVHFNSWKGFAANQDLTPDGWSNPDPRPEGELSLCISPLDMSAWSEPTEEQASAFQHLLDNESEMRDVVLQGVFREYPSWRATYYGGQISSDGGKTYQPASAFPEMFPPENMPEISQVSDLTRLVRPHGIHILKDAKDGFAEVGFAFACKWDEEHGLGVLTHKGQVIQVGDGTASFDHI